MKKGNEYEIIIEDTEFPGYGISHAEGFKVYVRNAFPGQKILVRITKKRKKYAEAKIIKIIDEVDYKINSPCLHFGLCGGCTSLDVSYEKQVEFKEHQVLELFKKAGIEGFEYLGIEKSPQVYGYRNKMEFTFGDFEKGGELTLGMHAKNLQYSIVNAEGCSIAPKDYSIILAAVLEYLKKANLTHYKVMSHEGFLRNLVVRKAQNTNEILINIVTTSEVDFDFSDLISVLVDLPYEGKLTGIIHCINDSLSDTVSADKIEVLYGRDYIYEELCGLKFKISPFSFFQTNSKGAEKLYLMVKDFLQDTEHKTVFDLYCGTGTIGQIIAKDADKVIGIELVEEAVKSANENARLNGLSNCRFIAGDVAKIIKNINIRPDAIVLDPPRPGVQPEALKHVLEFCADGIVYVSCNPKSLVRDLNVILESGYAIQKVKLMDMFPSTPHIETVCLMSKVK